MKNSLKMILRTFMIVCMSYWIFAFHANAQQEFVKLYGDANSNLFAKSYFDATENAFYSIGQIDTIISFSKMNAEGEVLWTKCYGLSGMFNSYTKAPNGDFLLAGDVHVGNDRRYCVARVDTTGTLIWLKTYSASGRISSVRITQAVNNTYFIEGWKSPNVTGGQENVALVKINGSGNVLWAKEYNGGGSEHSYDILPLSNGGCIIAGASTAINWDSFVLQVDAHGSIAQVQRYGSGFVQDEIFFDKFIRANDNGYIAAGRMYESGSGWGTALIKLNTTGAVEWVKKWPTPAYVATGLIQDVYGDIYMAAGGYPDMHILKFTETGSFIWAKSLPIAVSSNHKYSTLAYDPTKPNQIILTGGQDAPSNGFGSWDPVLAVTDTALSTCLTTDFTVSITSPNLHASNWNLATSQTGFTVNSYTTIEDVVFGESNICEPYQIPDTTIYCHEIDCTCCGAPKVCIPLIASVDVPAGITGMDYCIEYDNSLMSPTGNVTLGEVVLTSSPYADYYVNYTVSPNKVYVSIYYTGQAPLTAEFVGEGEIACVEFTLSSNFIAGTTADFSVCEIIESYRFHTEAKAAEVGSLTLENDGILEGRIIFWDDDTRPLRYDSLSPSNYLETVISGADNFCSATPTTTPDTNGYFNYHIVNGGYINLNRDIDCNTNVMPVINGMDCYWMGLVTTLNASYVPNPYQMIAMDVNRDGQVAAGDITSVQNRIVQNICEYPQLAATSIDWAFIDETAQDSADYYPSTTYPFDDGQGYSKYNTPNVPDCMEVQVTDNGGYCTYIDSMDFHAVLLGDANGTWDANPPIASELRMSGTTQIIFDLSQATTDENCHLHIPIFYQSDDNLMAFDFAMDYDESQLAFQAIENPNISSDDIGMAWNNLEGNRLFFTSYAKVAGGITTANAIGTIIFESTDGTIQPSDLGAITTYFNGEQVSFEVVGDTDCLIALSTEEQPIANAIQVYPNPMREQLVITYGQVVQAINRIQLYNAQGGLIENVEIHPSGTTTLDVSSLPKGVYFLQINEHILKKLIK